MPISKTALASAILALVVTAIAIDPASASSKLRKRWVGEEAGKFFAAYGPPTSDLSTSSRTVYGWRGGYSSRKVPAVKDKSGKIVQRARTERLVCQLKLTVDRKYTISKIEVVVDKPGAKGEATWCERYLDAAD